jgi:hypothetical protein
MMVMLVMLDLLTLFVLFWYGDAVDDLSNDVFVGDVGLNCFQCLY